MTKRTFQLIALVTLPLAGLLTFVVGRFLAPFLVELSPDLGALLTLLAYLLGTLAGVVVWAFALWPLRRRAGFPSFGDEVGQVRRDGIVASVRREREVLDAKASSQDPATRADYYKSMCLAGVLVTFVGALLSVALLADGILMAFPLALALVGLPLSVYYGVQYLRWSSRR